MKTASAFRSVAAAGLLALAAGQAVAGEARVAVASNFTSAVEAIAERFEAATDHEVTLVFGSTGKHYAQIHNGAPFDAFFAADVKRPRLLDEEGMAVPKSRFTYAVGRIVLWSPKEGYVDPEGRVLEGGGFRHLAIANPRLAPYGKAAEQVLRGRGLWDTLRGRMVRGENIGQAFQFVKSGSAELGFVAYSQVKRPNRRTEGSLWAPPRSSYSPIEQQAVLLNENEAARAFMAFVKGPEATAIIQGFGYGTPAADQ